MTAIANYWSGMEFDLYCSDEDFKALGKENAYCVINHKYDIDWLIGWVFSQRVNMLGVSFLLLLNYIANRTTVKLHFLWSKRAPKSCSKTRSSTYRCSAGPGRSPSSYS